MQCNCDEDDSSDNIITLRHNSVYNLKRSCVAHKLTNVSLSDVVK
jgi:hypothetical protein